MEATLDTFKHVVAVFEGFGSYLANVYVPREFVCHSKLGSVHFSYCIDKSEYSELELAIMESYSHLSHGMPLMPTKGEVYPVEKCDEHIKRLFTLLRDGSQIAVIATSNPTGIGSQLSKAGIPWIDMTTGPCRIPSYRELAIEFDGAWFCSEHRHSLTGDYNPNLVCAERIAHQVEGWIARLTDAEKQMEKENASYDTVDSVTSQLDIMEL
ncbi:hypothetical protein HDE_08679 [Halotydeus destructor]|nr:hypothetical protein HDE_08679 [Halotydeus destructor]